VGMSVVPAVRDGLSQPVPGGLIVGGRRQRERGFR
jgi:hypothetical protein